VKNEETFHISPWPDAQESVKRIQKDFHCTEYDFLFGSSFTTADPIFRTPTIIFF